MDYSEKILKLGDLYREYGIYPLCCFGPSSPIIKIRKHYPNDHYTKELDLFLRGQQLEQSKRGADLPWWGKCYFNDKVLGNRIMIITQDSLSKDAGSTVFYACLMDKMTSEEFKVYRDNYQLPIFKSWKKAKEMIMSLGDHNLFFITDAMKVYNESSNDDGDFNRMISLELIHKEIEFCNPDLVIILGESSCKLILNVNYSKVVSDQILLINDRHYLVGPFPSNQSNKKLFTERTDRLIDSINRFFDNKFNQFVCT